MKRLSFSVFLAGSFFILSCKNERPKTLKKPEISFTKEGNLIIHSKPSDSIIKTLDIEIADNDYETQTGLMYRKSMQDNQAMLFVFEDSKPRSFYMKNTFIPLDIIYINEEKKIVSFQENAKPLNENSLPSEGNAQYVLEIKSGLAKAWGLKIGDSISYNKQ